MVPPVNAQSLQVLGHEPGENVAIVCRDAGDGGVRAFGGKVEGDQLALEEVLARIKPLMESPDLAKCAHNANFDLMMLGNYGIKSQNVDFDTMIAAHLLSRTGLGLKNLAQEVLGRGSLYRVRPNHWLRSSCR